MLSTGGIDCWGSASAGVLGNGTVVAPDGEGFYDTPQAVTGAADADSVAGAWDGAGYCAVFSIGGAACWGDNYYGELGNGTIGGPDGESGYDTPQGVSFT